MPQVVNYLYPTRNNMADVQNDLFLQSFDKKFDAQSDALDEIIESDPIEVKSNQIPNVSYDSAQVQQVQQILLVVALSVFLVLLSGSRRAPKWLETNLLIQLDVKPFV